MGERPEFPQRGPGGAPAAYAFLAYLGPQNAAGGDKNSIDLK